LFFWKDLNRINTVQRKYTPRYVKGNGKDYVSARADGAPRARAAKIGGSRERPADAPK
jgi:hypothetical protein